MRLERPLFAFLRPAASARPAARAQAPLPRLATWHMAADRADFGPRGAG